MAEGLICALAFRYRKSMSNGTTPGERIRARRSALGLKQADVAQAAGMPASTLSKFEGDRQPIRYSDLEKLATALSCAVYDLIPPPTNKRAPSRKRSAIRQKGAA